MGDVIRDALVRGVRVAATIDAAQWPHDASAARDCLALNRAFRAWGHRFLYNRAMLVDVTEYLRDLRIE